MTVCASNDTFFDLAQKCGGCNRDQYHRADGLDLGIANMVKLEHDRVAYPAIGARMNTEILRNDSAVDVTLPLSPGVKNLLNAFAFRGIVLQMEFVMA